MRHDIALDGHILNIVQNQNVPEQNHLQNLLKARGFNIPQATLSRRLKKLKIAKVAGVYRIIDFNQSSLPLILNIQISEFGLIVLQTHPGQANSLAYFLDQKYVIYSSFNPQKSGILGTIAGDDTVLLVIKSKADLGNVFSIIGKDFPYLETALE